MPSIAAISTTRAPFHYGREEILAAAAQWLEGRPELHPLFTRFVEKSQTAQRSFSIPLDSLLSLGSAQQRAELFEREGMKLGKETMHSVIAESDENIEEIRSLVFTSCTAPVIPSIDAALVEYVGLSRSIARIPIYQQGCAGGVVGLALAEKLARANGTVLLTSVELCSLVFQPCDFSPGQLVGSAIFADGAASVLVSPEERDFVFVASQSYLIPETRHLMGYDILENGTHLRLDKDLPTVLAGVVPELVGTFLASNGLSVEKVQWWLFHPGGIRILDYLESVFSLSSARAGFSRHVLTQYGNMSSASVLFVLQEFLSQRVSKKGDFTLMLGIGPGLTLELILFRHM